MDYKSEWRKRTRSWALNTLGGRCSVCGGVEELEFDHIDPSTKEIEISVAIRDGWGKSRLGAELKKCQLLCKSHHLEKTSRHGENTGGGWNKISDPEHGTWAMYTNFKCRCEECRKWRSLYRIKAVDARGNPRTSQSDGNM